MKDVTRQLAVHYEEKQNNDEDKWHKFKEWEKALLDDLIAIQVEVPVTPRILSKRDI
ncbi:hypothetical protein [Bacillus sp. FJAT-52991]|uniref:Uncharacterized protein n=1 Tax=Bacillus kandeliae TaxID=3129297 RepID=A0ABZ2N4E4_9BACI